MTTHQHQVIELLCNRNQPNLDSAVWKVLLQSVESKHFTN